MVSSKMGTSKKSDGQQQQAQLHAPQTQSHDGACANCRIRKIRCDRERPTCGGCAREQVECVYSTPSKRVNHIKVLCQDFDEIQQRLISVQRDLSLLTEAYKRGVSVHDWQSPNRHFVSSQPVPAAVSPTYKLSSTGHVTRDNQTLIENYHGPWTLGEQWRLWLKDLQSSTINNDALISADGDITATSTQHLLEDVGGFRSPQRSLTGENNGLSVHHPADAGVSRPPRQFLEVTLESFFRQVDFTTDIFVRETVESAIAHIYSGQDHGQDSSKSWTVCLNLIVLHALGSQGPVQMDDPFIRPLLQATRFVARSPELLLTRRLVVMQSLALLSLFAHEYQGETLGDSFFAQSCMLAKMMGLESYDQAVDANSPLGVSSIHIEERNKLYRSLYIRDRLNATIRGAQSWLPSTKFPEVASTSLSRSSEHSNVMAATSEECSAPHDGEESTLWSTSSAAVRQLQYLALARIQDDLHRIAFSDNTSSAFPFSHHSAVIRVQQDLVEWSLKLNIPGRRRPTTLDDIQLYLTYFATWLRLQPLLDVVLGDPYNSPSAKLLDYARICCLLVVHCCHPPAQVNVAMTERLNTLLALLKHNHGDLQPNISEPSRSASVSVTTASLVGFSNSTQATSQASGGAESPTTNEALSTTTLVPVHRVATFLPAVAIFTLARHVIGIRGGKDPGHPSTHQPTVNEDTEQDVFLLQQLACIFSSSPATTTSDIDTYTTKLSRITQRLADVVASATSKVALSSAQLDPRPSLGDSSANNNREGSQKGSHQIPASSAAAQDLNMDLDPAPSTRMSRRGTSGTSQRPPDIPSSASAVWSDMSPWQWDGPSSGVMASPSTRATPGQMDLSDAWLNSFDVARLVEASPPPAPLASSKRTWGDGGPTAILDTVVVRPSYEGGGSSSKKRSRREVE